MAMYALRLRRVLSLSSCIINHHKPLCSSVPALPAPPQLSISSSQNPKLDRLNFPFQSRAFRASNVSLSSRPRTSYRDNNDDNKISPDEILFEGCDYNHWLITIDFPKDPKPSPEEMVETYVQTAAKVLGSVEEAKKKIYACSTTTYNGFQVEVSEEMSEKFKGLPGVVFVLPDSYIDPVNKEYGGDKYINGTIIPRPPPISFARSSGRYGDRNRDFNRPRGSYQQGNSTFDNQGSMQGNARNFGPPQNPPQQNYGPPRAGSPQQNYGPPGVGERRDPMPMSNSPAGLQGDRRDPLPPPQQNYGPPRVGPSQQNYGPPRVGPPQQNYGSPRVGERRDPMPMNNSPAGLENYQGDRRDPLPPPQQNYGPPRVGPPQQNYGPPRVGERRDPMPMSNSPAGLENYQADRKDPLPSYQGNYSQGHIGNSYPQGQRGFPPVEQQTNYVPLEQKDFGVGNKNYASPQGGGFGQRAGGNFGQGTGWNFGQGEGRNYGQGAGGNFGQGAGGNFGQEAGGNFGQSAGGNNGHGVGGGFGQGLGGVPGQETGLNYRQSYSGHGENQRFQEEEPINMQQDQ